MGKTSEFNVEIFYNGRFHQWFPATSISGVLKEIARYERVEKLSDVKMSYLVFQKADNGRWKSLGSRWLLACKINSNGKEKPEFFSLAS